MSKRCKAVGYVKCCEEKRNRKGNPSNVCFCAKECRQPIQAISRTGRLILLS